MSCHISGAARHVVPLRPGGEDLFTLPSLSVTSHVILITDTDMVENHIITTLNITGERGEERRGEETEKRGKKDKKDGEEESREGERGR